MQVQIFRDSRTLREDAILEDAIYEEKCLYRYSY